MGCNRDCFNCSYDDCIVEGLSTEERKEILKRDQQIKEEKTILSTYYAKYNHSEKGRERTKKYLATEKGKAKIRELRRKYNNGYRKQWMEKHREEYNAYQRAYRHAKKERKAMLDTILCKDKKDAMVAIDNIGSEYIEDWEFLETGEVKLYLKEGWKDE